MARPARLYREKTRQRMRAEADAARRGQVRRRRRALAAGVGVLATGVGVGVFTVFSGARTAPGGASHPVATPYSPTPSPPSVRGTPVCDFQPSPQDTGRHVGLPPDRKAAADGRVVLTTSLGAVAITLDAKRAPCTTTAVSWLVKQHYYDGSDCPVLAATVKVHLLQCGATPAAPRAAPGFTLAEEGLSGATYPRGTVAMLRATPAHSTGSQLLIVYKDSQLPARYTPVGTVSSGLSVIDEVASKGVKTGKTVGLPTLGLTIASASVAA